MSPPTNILYMSSTDCLQALKVGEEQPHLFLFKEKCLIQSKFLLITLSIVWNASPSMIEGALSSKSIA